MWVYFGVSSLLIYHSCGILCCNPDILGITILISLIILVLIACNLRKKKLQKVLGFNGYMCSFWCAGLYFSQFGYSMQLLLEEDSLYLLPQFHIVVTCVYIFLYYWTQFKEIITCYLILYLLLYISLDLFTS